MAAQSEPTLITVVFVDVEGSTALFDRVGDALGLHAVDALLEVARTQCLRYGGNETKSLGDGLLLTFDSPGNAVAFALATQRVITGATGRLRIGINTGEVRGARDDPVGGAVNAAARIAGRASGGEVLVSDVVRQLVGASPSVQFTDRGRHRLKGFPEPWRLYAAHHGGRASERATFGRATEQITLDAALTSVHDGSGCFVLVEGEAGIGKSHLVAQTVTDARARGMRVVEYQADEIVRRPSAFAHALATAFRDGSETAQRLDRILAERAVPMLDRDDITYAILESCIELLDECAAAAPVVVAAEDLHWSDDVSLRILAALARRAPSGRVVVVATCRPTPRSEMLDRITELAASPTAHHLRLRALEPIDVQALATSITGAASGPTLRARLDSAAGNPMFVCELVRSFDDAGQLQFRAGVAELTETDLPNDLRAMLVRRLAGLASETSEVLRLASILGSSFSLRELAAVAGRSVVDVAAALTGATHSELVVGEGDQLRFRHDLIREAIYDAMLPAIRRDLHQVAGRALAQLGAVVTDVARQFSLGAVAGDLEAVTWLERAANETILVDPQEAVRLFEQALFLAPADWPRRADTQVRLIEPLAGIGRFDPAKQLAERLLEGQPDPEIAFASLRGLSAVLGNQGDIAGAIEVLHRAADSAGAPSSEARRLRCLAAQLTILSGSDYGEQRVLLDHSLVEAVAYGDRPLQCLVQQALGLADLMRGHADAAVEHLETAVVLWESGEVPWASYLSPDLFVATGLVELDRLDDAAQAAERARRAATHAGRRAILPMAHSTLAGVHYLAGRWDDAIAECQAALAVSDDSGSHNFVLYCDAILAMIALRRGHSEEAQRCLDQGIARFESGAPAFGLDWLFGAQADILADSGDQVSALELAANVWTSTSAIRYTFGHRPRAVALVRLAVACGRHDIAREVTEALQRATMTNSSIGIRAAANACSALSERELDAARVAVELYRSTPLRPELALVCEDAATIALASDDRDSAIPYLEEALAVTDGFEANRDRLRILDRLGRLGRNIIREKPARPTFGWGSLTVTEHKVSALVADGLTNPQIGERLFISRRTVETHLSHVYTKLGITSRAQLAAAVVRHEPPSEVPQR